jgi:8-oxo-dGTP diphosphatase
MKEVTAAIIHKDDKILICRRSADDECGLLWEFPGGKREVGESLEECIIREIREELMVEIELMDIFDKSIYYFNDLEVHFTVYRARLLHGEPQLIVHDSIEWIHLEDVVNYEFMPPDRVFVKKLLEEKNQRFA